MSLVSRASHLPRCRAPSAPILLYYDRGAPMLELNVRYRSAFPLSLEARTPITKVVMLLFSVSAFARTRTSSGPRQFSCSLSVCSGGTVVLSTLHSCRIRLTSTGLLYRRDTRRGEHHQVRSREPHTLPPSNLSGPRTRICIVRFASSGSRTFAILFAVRPLDRSLTPRRNAAASERGRARDGE